MEFLQIHISSGRLGYYHKQMLTKGESIMLLLETAVTTTELSGAFVVAMGMGTVFIGLICIILLVKLMSLIINGVAKDEAAKPAAPVAAPAVASAAAPVPAEIPNRAEFVAAVSAAIAEDLGTDISKIQIVSIKRI